MRSPFPGRALFLVGPSSSGKTSIGRQIVDVLTEPWFFYEADTTPIFHRPTDRSKFATVEMEERLTVGTALALRGYLDAGLDIVVERSLWWPGIRQRTAAAFAGYPAYLIGLQWQVDELVKREQARDDGILPGTAEEQALGWGPGAWDLPFDFLVNPLQMSAVECAQRIATWLETKPSPRGISTLAHMD